MPAPILLVTRPRDAGRRLVDELQADGWVGQVQLAPLTRLDPIDPGPLPAVSGVILSSEEAAKRAASLGLGDRPAWCVGPRTAMRARESGSQVRRVPDANHLVAHMAEARPSGLWLHLHGRETTRDAAGRDLVGRLVDAGVIAEGRVVYAQEPCAFDAAAASLWASDVPIVAPVLSTHGAHRLMAASGGPRRAPLHVVAISEAVAEQANALRPAWTEVARAPDGASLRVALRKAWERASAQSG